MSEQSERLGVCPACGQRALERTREPIVTEFREGSWTLQPDFEYERCRTCGEEFYSGPEIVEFTRKVVRLARCDLGLLSPEEVRDIRLNLGLTQGELEAALGVSRGMVGRWERGDVIQGATVDRLIRLFGENPDLLRSPAIGLVAREGRGPYRGRR
ncbi:MAG: type II TA system antitoxin MqsA family protein [Coriobacteriia bacterium]